MRVLWSIEYKGSDPANCHRKVARLLNIEVFDEVAIPWIDKTYYVQFFSEINATSWELAIAELLEIASKFSSRWLLTISKSNISASSTVRKIANVITLSFELAENQKYILQSGLTHHSSEPPSAAADFKG